MIYKRNTMGIHEKAKLEAAALGEKQLQTENEKITANIDYIAMMTDVELPEEETEDEQ